jgi:uncharacterized protein YciI
MKHFIMDYYLLALSPVIIFLLISCRSDQNNSLKPAEDMERTYDSLLASSLGADAYGMKSYVMAFLKTGPNRSQDSATIAEIQQAHLENIIRLADEGKLILAGPFLDNGELRGIYVFNVSTLEEARKLTLADPAVRAGRLVMELHPWYGSAALQQLYDIHKRLERKSVAE